MSSRTLSLAGWLSLSLLAAIAASSFPAGGWYQDLANPAWAPPRIVLAVAWPLFYVLIAISGWQAREAGHRVGAPELPVFMTALFSTLVLTVGWFWLLLGLHRPGWSLAGVSVLAVCLVFTSLRYPAGRSPSRTLLVPCVVWVIYLWAWNLAVWRLNGGGLGSILG